MLKSVWLGVKEENNNIFQRAIPIPSGTRLYRLWETISFTFREQIGNRYPTVIPRDGLLQLSPVTFRFTTANLHVLTSIKLHGFGSSNYAGGYNAASHSEIR